MDKRNYPNYLDQTHPSTALVDIDLLVLKEFLGRLDLPHHIEKYLEPTIHFRGDIPDLVTHPPGNLEKAVPRNFTVLLFGSEPHRFFRGAYAILSMYDGLERDAARSTRFEIFGPIPVLIKNLMDKLQLHMGMEIDKTVDFMQGDPNRHRFSKYAIQEAIVNAFVHRDYHSYDPVRVTVFTDRIEVTSPGGPIADLKPEQVQRGEVFTSWRNPSLAWFMVELKYARNEGQGIRTIIRQTRNVSGRDPLFRINIDWFNVVIPAYVPESSQLVSEANEQDPLKRIEKICSRFHLVAKQLRLRYSDRATLEIKDEYDTRDLLHSLLHIYFDDIRPEEWSPDYAGGSSRVDFLLKEEQVVIEVKKARKTLKAKQIADELLVDIQRYRQHSDCKKLICFVYDPEEWVVNPRGLEKDLAKTEGDFVVKVIIVPRGH